MNDQFKKGALELCVLAQLAQGDKYGYELTARISEQIGVANGTLYLILRRLHAEDYVQTYLQESPSGPARKYYRLTSKGRAYLKDMKDEWQTFVRKIDRLI